MDMIDLLGDAQPELRPGGSDLLPASFFYEEDAPVLLADGLLQETTGRRVLVLFDTRTREVAAERCVEALRSAGWEPIPKLVPDSPDGASPVCDDLTFENLKSEAPPSDAMVAVGSGVINDLTKWLAADAGRPYATLATAASMNGYAAANVAPAIDGVKSLRLARAPRIVAAEPQIIAAAPPRLTTAGLGDVIAKPVSTADWLMNHLVFEEDYSESIAGIISGVEPMYLGNPEGLAGRDPRAVEGLFRALILSGCAMTLQGSSLPASGGEHLISHTLDMKAHVSGGAHDLHGRQVGVATIFAAALYQRLLAAESPAFGRDPLCFDPDYWGSLGAAVGQEHARSVSRISAATDWLGSKNNWDRLRAGLETHLKRPGDIKGCLSKAGGAHAVADIGCTRESFAAAVRNAACIRERFTSLSLGLAAGLLPGCIEDILDEWLL